MTEPYYSDDAVTLYHGDCIEVMRSLPEDSIDAILTDPPYGLEFMGKSWDSFAPSAMVKRSGWDTAASSARITEGDGKPHGRVAFHKRRSTFQCKSCGKRDGFRNPHPCGDQWESVWVDRDPVEALAFGEWSRQWATEAMRVLKPGGHLLAFGGTRTWHRLACAIEDAGFEVRDSIAWMYGSGFPKSLDVSKAIDRKRDEGHDAERRDVILTVTNWVADARNAAGITNRQIDEHFGFAGMAGHWTSSKSQPSVPTAEQWPRLLQLLKVDEPPQEVRDAVDEWLRIKGQPAPTWSLREVTGHHEQAAAGQQWNANYGQAANLQPKERRDKPATPEAAKWQGWGTALKPAFEPIVVARKPLTGTVAENVQQWGTGALNIDGCRIGTDGGTAGATSGPSDGIYGNGLNGDRSQPVPGLGSWPANVILDESQAAELDRQSGVMPAGNYPAKRNGIGYMGGAVGTEGEKCTTGDTGGASRFFYTAKADSSERPRVDGIAHPTVKPLDLMRYLVRLVTPPGGTVLEPFAGSGTTAEACIIEGFRCVAIEITDDYLPLIMQRITKPIEVTLL